MEKQLLVASKIIQAPMAGITTPSFVAACCEAGALGFIGAGYLNGEQTREQIKELKSLTNKSFGVNLFIQEEPQINVSILHSARMALQPIYEELDIKDTPTVTSREVFSGQIDAVVEEQVPIVSFTFGVPEQGVVDRLRAYGAYIIGTATTLEEAEIIQQRGLDAAVLQGSEAGGHRGSFLEPFQMIPLRELLAQVKDHITIPMIAAGGIMTRQHVEEVLALGADYAQLGTALMTADECEANELHKNAILNSKEAETTITRAFTGKPARGLRNEFTERLKDAVVAPYPLQHHLTVRIRQISGQTNRPEYLSLWMGENSYLAKKDTAASIISNVMPTK